MTSNLDPGPSSPRLEDLLELKSRNAQAELRTFLVAKVERWIPEDQAIDAQPLVQKVRRVRGEEVVTNFPKITRVPVSFLRWGGFVIRCGLSAGDTVGLLVADRELERWLSLEQNRTDIVRPQSDRMHSLDDVVAIPGFSPWGQPISGLSDGELVIGREDGDGEIRIKTDGAIELGSQSASKRGVARKDDSTESTIVDDPDFWAWLLAIHALVQTPSPPNAPLAGLSVYLGLYPDGPPDSQKGKITSASGKVSTE